MASLENLIVGIIEVIVGAFLLVTGIGGGLGAKLLLAGALTIASTLFAGPTGLNGWRSSPTYGHDNLGNAQYEGSPVAVIYGEHKVLPGVVSVNLKGNGATQVLFLLCLVGEGPIQSISQIRLNDVAIESFPGVVATTDRLGQSDQAVIPDFNETGTQYPGGARISYGQTFINEMKAVADSLSLQLVFPAVISPGGGSAKFRCKMEYRAHGSTGTGGWTTFSPASDDSPAWKLHDGQAGTWSFWAATREALRMQLVLRFDGKSGRPPRGRYQVRFTNIVPTSPGDISAPEIASVIELVNDQRAYAGFALLGLKIPASAQLSGIPRVSCVVKGRKLFDPRTSTTAWSDNPVLAAYDILTNATYGLGLDSSKIDSASFQAMANACDATVSPVGGGSAEKKWSLDYVIDTDSPWTDHVAQMLSTCRMTLARINRKVYIVQDAVKSTSRDFEARAAAAVANRRNVRDTGSPRRSTLSASSLDASQRFTKVRVTYVDRNRDWQQKRVEIFDTYINVGAIAGGSFGAGNQIKGTTSKALARVTATYANGARYITFAQADGATQFVSGETVTDLTTGASATTSSAPYVLSPERVLDVSGFGITRRSQAVREARYHLNNARSRTRFASWGGSIGDIDLLPGAVVTMSADHLPWTSKKLVLLALGIDADGLTSFSAREYNEDVYFDNVDATQLDAVFFLPGGAIPPGVRDPSISTPSSSGSSGNSSASTAYLTGSPGIKPGSYAPNGSIDSISVAIGFFS